MNPTAPQTPARTLRPVAQHFDKHGAPVVPLSPTRGMRNASIIYEKIKDLPDQTVIRADYDRQGKPFLYFPRAKKMSHHARDLLDTANAQADRQEALNIMLVIAQEVQAKSDVSQETRLAALRFGLKVRQRSIIGDIRVADVREALVVIHGVQQGSEAGRSGRQRGAQLRAQLANFIGMPAHLKAILTSVLETGRTSGYVGASAAVDAMFRLVQEFLSEHPRGDARAFLSHVGHYPLSAELIRFAWQWRKFAAEKNTTAGFLFRQMPWAKQIAFAARVIKFIAHRVGRWKEPGRDPERSILSSRVSSSSCGPEPAATNAPQAALDVTAVRPGRERQESQRTLVSLPKEEASSDVQVLSPLLRRDESRIQSYQRLESESSDLRVFSPLRQDADAAASTKSPAASPATADRVPAHAEASESEFSVRSLLDNIDWMPLGDSDAAADPTG